MVLSKFGRAKRVRLARIGLGASALAAMLLPVTFATRSEAKTPGSTYCYHGKCHRVKTIEETQALVGVEETLYASHYDDCSRDRYNPCGLTSSGEKFHPDRPDNTASPIYPDGTTLLVWSAKTERALVVRVNNAGPYWGNRTLDLSRAAAEKLGFDGEGVAQVRVRVIKAPEPAEAKYVANRNYPPVPGDIGQYASLEQAQTGMAVALALQASAGSPMAPVTTANAFAQQDTGMIVAEAPQTFGRGLAQVAYVPPVSKVASLSFGDLLPQTVRQSHQRQMASLSLDRDVNQSRWGEDLLDDAAAPAVDTNSDITTGSIAKPAQEAAVKEEVRPEPKKQVARRVEKDDDEEARPSRSRKSQARERTSRSAEQPRRRSNRDDQLAYSMERAEPRREWRERSAGEQMSLGIRAQSSSTM